MSEYILKTSNLTKKYKNYKAIINVSLSLEAGKIYGLIGRNGAGKSTFMKLIAVLSYPDEGPLSYLAIQKKVKFSLKESA